MAEQHGCGAADVRMLLIRHAPSTWNEQMRWQGWADPPLSRDWAGPVLAAADALPSCITTIACSDLIRARGTASRIAERLGIGPVQVREQLREQHAGLWTGLTKAEIKQQWPHQLRARPRQPTGGETSRQVVARVSLDLAELAAEQPMGSCILVVTHSAVIRSLEVQLGAPAAAVDHLQGRWFGIWPDGRIVAGDPSAGRAGATVNVG